MGDDIKSFKIGDSHRAGMTTPATKAGKLGMEAAEATQSLGFTRIEGLLDDEDPVAVGDSLNAILKSLEELHAGASTNRDKLQAQKAMVAVEKAVDLMDYLYQTKESLES